MPTAGNVLPPFVRHYTANPGATLRVMGQLCEPVQSPVAESCEHAVTQRMVSGTACLACVQSGHRLHDLNVNTSSQHVT